VNNDDESLRERTESGGSLFDFLWALAFLPFLPQYTPQYREHKPQR
jgi:hypothetical protein